MIAAPVWVEVDTDAIASNLRALRAEVGASVDICAVVKADAYGHGIDATLPVLLTEHVAIIGVASNAEAEQVRRGGFSGRLIRLRAALEEEIADGISSDIEEWVGGVEHATVVDRVARAHRRRLRTHLSLNSTGLSRDGVEAEDEGALTSIGALAGLDVVGIASHFPREDAEHVARTAARFHVESTRVAALLGRQLSTVQRHCASTHATLTVPSSRFDMVRIGAALYGDTDVLGAALTPAMRVVTRIAAINEYPEGRTVGYNATHRLDASSRLAVIPVGYADGYHRGFGGAARVLVRGTRAPVIDLLAMNACIVDVTHVTGAAVGDEVVLYGPQENDAITSADIHRYSGHIAADAYTAWGRLMPRRATTRRRAEAGA